MSAAHTTDFDERMSLPTLGKMVQDINVLRRHGIPLHFICYDISALRKINFAFGREVGDEVIRVIARWVAMTLPGSLYRVEGDLFCLVLQHQNCETVHQMAMRAFNRSREPWDLAATVPDSPLFVTASICVIRDNPAIASKDLPDLFERTLDKARAQKTVAIYDPAADQVAQDFIRFQLHLESCVLNGMRDFHLVYQPIVEPISGMWCGVEALCRWKSNEFGSVPPPIFVPEVERQGLMSVMGTWVLENAIIQCRRLELDKLEDFILSVNVSASQVTQPDFADVVQAVVERHGYPYNRLNLEITESTEFNFTQSTMETIRRLREKGITFALDDFGTGYSTFSNMNLVPAQYIKTEREFIADIETDNYLQYSLYVISETAHLHGMRLIAEGIETREQLLSALKNGADLIQGYYFCTPISGDDLAKNLHHFHQADQRVYGNYLSSVDLNQWLNSKQAYAITPALFGLVNQCMSIMLNEDDLDHSISRVLETIGKHFKVKRAFVFLRDAGTVFSNTYEWCEEGAVVQIELFQNTDMAEDGFYQLLVEQETIIISQNSQLPEGLRRRMIEAGQPRAVESLLVRPMKSKGEVIGFVGFDDSRPREWMPEEILLLNNLCLLVLMRLNPWGRGRKT